MRSAHTGRLKAVPNEALQELAAFLRVVGLQNNTAATIRVCRHDGFVRSLQVIYPCLHKDPKLCAGYAHVLDHLNVPDFGTVSIQFTLNADGEVVKAVKISEEESIDLRGYGQE